MRRPPQGQRSRGGDPKNKKGKGGGKAMGTGDADLHWFMGTSITRGLVCVDPGLLAWIADRKHQEMMLLKEDRKWAAEKSYASGTAKPPAED